MPLPPSTDRQLSPSSRGVHLKLQHVRALPVPPGVRTLTNLVPEMATPAELQLSVSLFDEASGTFFGNTCHSARAPIGGPAAGGAAMDVPLDMDVHFHTTVSDARCVAVVELILRERAADGKLRDEYSAGFALVRLFETLSSGGRGGAAQVLSGSPRYLLFKALYGTSAKAPPLVMDCQVVFQASFHDALVAAQPLVPENFLLMPADTVPGLRRFSTATGHASVARKGVQTWLQQPQVAPIVPVALRGVQLAVPLALHDMLESLFTQARQ